MSELWDRCREQLQARLANEDWQCCIRPLRAWMDAGALYLWVDREPRDWRPRPNPARDFDAAIREAVRLVWGREPTSIHYLEVPPSRRRIIEDRRIPEHRAKVRRNENRMQSALRAYAREECQKLLADPKQLRLTGTTAEKEATLHAMIMSRAKARLEKEGLSTLGRRSEPPPEEPTLLPPAPDLPTRSRP